MNNDYEKYKGDNNQSISNSSNNTYNNYTNNNSINNNVNNKSKKDFEHYQMEYEKSPYDSDNEQNDNEIYENLDNNYNQNIYNNNTNNNINIINNNNTNDNVNNINNNYSSNNVNNINNNTNNNVNNINNNNLINNKPEKNNKLIIVLIIIIILIGTLLFAINLNDYTLTIISNNLDTNTLSCRSLSIFGYDFGCNITLPEIENSTDDSGYSDEFNYEVMWRPNDKIKLIKDKEIYSFTGKLITVKFVANKAEYIEYTEQSCLIQDGEYACEITIPMLNKIGENRMTFSINKNYKTNSLKISEEGKVFFFHKKYLFDKDTTLYETIEESSKRNINTSYNAKIGNTFFEIESSCSEKQKKEAINTINNINTVWPFLTNISGRLSIISPTTFAKIWPNEYSSGAVGITNMIDNKYASVADIDLTCDYIKLALVHEMVHRLDYEYSVKTGELISQSSEYLSLFNKYKKIFAANKSPFRDYAYSNEYEFLTESIRCYYYTYIEYDQEYSEPNFPDDVKSFIEEVFNKVKLLNKVVD